MNPLLVALFLFTQAAGAPALIGGKGTIKGTVVSAETGMPIASVPVSVLATAATANVVRVAAVSTDMQGRFEFSALDPGEYVILVDGTSQQYTNQAYGAAEPGSINIGLATATRVPLAVGQTAGNIVVRLLRGGTISGRILGFRGEPFVDAEVRLHSSRFDASGNKLWLGLPPGRNMTVNDRGEYRIFGIDPGRYYISAGPQIRLVVMTPGGEASRYAEMTLPPGVTEFAKASPLDIKPGTDITNLDIQLMPRPPTFKVRGRVLDSQTGQPPPSSNVQFSLVPRDREVGTLRGYQPQWGPDGSFELSDIVEGEYWISAQLRAPMMRPEPGQPVAIPPALGAFERIDVRGADVAGIVLTFVPPARVSGRLTAEGQPLSEISGRAGIRVQLDTVRNSAFAMNMGTSPKPAEIRADGSFVIDGVNPGEYRVRISGLPEGTYLEDARLGGIDAISTPLTIRKDPTDRLEVVLGIANAQIAGLVVNAGQSAVPNAQVVLIPEQMRGRADLYKTATTDASGRFVLRGILPGDYKVFSWASIQPFRYFDKDFVGLVEAKGEPVRAEEGVPPNVTVRQIP